MTNRDNELALGLMIVSARFARFARRHGNPADTSATWRALAILAEHESMRLGEFAAVDQLSQPTATAKLNRLVAEGLADRRSDEHDRRASRFALTARGAARLDSMRRTGLSCVMPGVEALDDTERATLAAAVSLLHRVLDVSAEATAITDKAPQPTR